MYDYMATILDQKKQKEKPKMLTLKKWNPVAMWSWDVKCNNCAICRVGIMNPCLNCQGKEEDAPHCVVVVWGDCNHSFHYCYMRLWVKQNNRCPLCQQDWTVQRIGNLTAEQPSKSIWYCKIMQCLIHIPVQWWNSYHAMSHQSWALDEESFSCGVWISMTAVIGVYKDFRSWFSCICLQTVSNSWTFLFNGQNLSNAWG